MKKIILFFALCATVLLFNSCETEQVIAEETEALKETTEAEDLFKTERHRNKRYFMVANRGSSTLSVFNSRNTNYIQDIALPDKGAQPTYLAHSRRNNAVYVGDFANQKVVYYDDSSFDMLGEIAIQEGAFHMWINDHANQLWVNNIVSKTTSVIDLYSNTVIANIALPFNEIPELTENAVQHDVTISPSGYAAYVTILDGPDTSYVVMYRTSNLEYLRHEVVGGDAHLLPVGRKLYVPSQNAGEITALNRFNLNEVAQIPFPSAHGIANSSRFVFATGIADNKIGVINRYSNQLVSEIDTDYSTPHNLAVNKNGRVLFLAHSGGTATKVVFYRVRGNGSLHKISDYDSGLNPFGVLSY